MVVSSEFIFFFINSSNDKKMLHVSTSNINMPDFAKNIGDIQKNQLSSFKKNCASTKRLIEGIVIKICVADARKQVFPSFDKPDGPFVPFSIDSKYFIIK